MNCKIKITTKQAEYKGMSIFERAAEELLISEVLSEYDNEDLIETSVYGEFSTQGGVFTLKYDEESQNMGATHTKLEFSLDAPERISIVRTGAIDTFMVYEKSKRSVCVYNTGIMPFEVCIFTRDITNELLEKGYLEIDYLVEIKGACAQQTTLKMEVEKR